MNISTISNEWILFLAVILSSIATFITRATPFYMIKNYKPSPWLNAIQKHMGLMIMVILVCYALKDTRLNAYPYGASEAMAVLIAILAHLKFKNTLVSIIVSTLFYMFFIRVFKI
ncbi:AzlD domain-containing protein [Campylobacter sp. RM13119]|uniref:branched-chain amino acid transporter permease n=1 Tax=Campylobacter californiensis TaxID=1032243 RepID=UPI001474DF1E|nr:AzlD domain-containing protein [Campylobacter sp. RM13119]MBE3605893.1 AzlD domain-containing protein [Campylobacter sp. RM13119]